MKLSTSLVLLPPLLRITSAQLPFDIQRIGKLRTLTIQDGRPTGASAKHATWLGDWNGDGTPEYFVTTKKGGTSSLFYSTSGGTWQATSHWYLPSYSVVVLDTTGDARPEYIIKTSKLKKDDIITQDMFADNVPGLGKSFTTVLKIPNDPINNALIPVMTFDRAVPIVQGCMDIDGDGYKDLLVTHHVEGAEFVARYYKGKNDTVDDQTFEATYRWASFGHGSSMGPSSLVHKARWGDIQVIGSSYRLFAAGAEDVDNNVLYWDYDMLEDTFETDPTIMDITDASSSNELHLTTVRALPGAIMLAGKDGAFFFQYRSNSDTYKEKTVSGLLPPADTEYSDFWCLPSGVRNDLMVFVILRKPDGNSDSVMEFRTFDSTANLISDILKEVDLPPRAQRIEVLRDDDSFDVNLNAKQLIVAHSEGATIYDIVPN